jgi:hypothetical protein
VAQRYTAELSWLLCIFSDNGNLFLQTSYSYLSSDLGPEKVRFQFSEIVIILFISQNAED